MKIKKEVKMKGAKVTVEYNRNDILEIKASWDVAEAMATQWGNL